ncbi:MAG: AAA family ATPase [Bacteroidales bacterium]|nr:AAA family ATPase [Bacteroidales bacterium]
MQMRGKYNFIKIERIVIRNFSLYKKNGQIQEINESIIDGIYCLAGANGLGKTTFLNAINYGLTGIVLAPDKEVYDPSQIRINNKKYTERYFVGRIKESEKEFSEIEILFSVNGKYFKLCRGFFEPETLRSLEIFVKNKNQMITLLDNTEKSPKQLNEIYQNELASTIGINNFDYFVFLQLYVFTFDENRRMVFWDDRASSHALAIAFNTDIKDSEKLISLQREIEKLDSYGRNYRWQATQVNKKIKELSEKKQYYPDIDSQQKEFEVLSEELKEATRTYNNVKTEYNTLLKNLSVLHSELMYKKQERTKLFSEYSEPRSKLLLNPYISHSIEKKECCVCGAKGDIIAENIEKNVLTEKCPMCGTSIKDSFSEEERENLVRLIEENDRCLSSKNNEIDVLAKEIEWKKIQVEKAEFDFLQLEKKLNNLLESNPLLSSDSTGNQGVDYLIGLYEKERDEAIKQSKASYSKRDELYKTLKKLQDRIENAYSEAESIFVPIFKDLAKSFIGLDLDIKLQRDKQIQKLVLELQNSARTESFQLSESQRFFLDIALRMAIAIYLATPTNPAFMLIDTPEGSLDIAYENRVGKMFANFILEYKQNIIMTANINASQLLISMAELCGNDKMKFKRMLDWTDLSVIQKEGEFLFDRVYHNIEHALNNK